MPIIKNLGRQTVNEIIQIETLCMVYKSIGGVAPSQKCSLGSLINARENYAILKLISKFVCVNLHTVKNASHTKVQQCGIVCICIQNYPHSLKTLKKGIAS